MDASPQSLVVGTLLTFFGLTASPGVHFLKDPRTNVYNFDPYLENVTQPDEFEFSLLNDFVPASKDPVS